MKSFKAHDFAKAGSDKKGELEEMEMHIDLHPTTSTSSYIMVETMSLVKAVVLFQKAWRQTLVCDDAEDTRGTTLPMLYMC